MPLLQDNIAATLVDLPGHGLTKISTGQRSSLTYMAQDLLTLCQALQLQPDLSLGIPRGRLWRSKCQNLWLSEALWA